MNSTGYQTSLQNFLSKHFPDIQLFRPCGSDVFEVWLPVNPAVPSAERALDEAWERNRG